MKIKLFNVFDLTFCKFLIVGIANTIFGTSIMFIFYNVFDFSYWYSSMANYIFGSILSYFLNKYLRFEINIQWVELFPALLLI